MKDYKIDIAVKNNRILQQMELLGYSSAADLCNSHLDLKYSQSIIGSFINLKQKPTTLKGEWSEPALKLSTALHCDPEFLWSEVQKTTALETNKKSLQFTENQVIDLMEQANPETLYIEMEKKSQSDLS